MSLTASYATLAIRQPPPREGPPATPAPTLDQLRLERRWKLRQRDALRRSIWRAQAFVEEHRPPEGVRRRIARAVAENLLQLADVFDDLESLRREIDAAETLHFGWRGVPPAIVP